MFENPRRDRQARNFTTNVSKILDLKSSSEQIFSENWSWVPLIDTIQSIIMETGSLQKGFNSFQPVASVLLIARIARYFHIRAFRLPVMIMIIRNAKNARGLGRDRAAEALSPIFPAATAPFPKSCASYFRFARFNTFPLNYLRAWHRLRRFGRWRRIRTIT